MALAKTRRIVQRWSELSVRAQAKRGSGRPLCCGFLIHRRMRVDELRAALGVELDTTDVKSDNLPFIQTVLASCLGLVTVDHEESTVHLIHFTLQEYFNRHSETFLNPYSTVAAVCLTYLNFDCVKTSDCSKLCATHDTLPRIRLLLLGNLCTR
ncbi:hypothetical protein L873DRAFT_635200 [Choiromyces venosus 120613-1]|uniref:GPI inositol-deacylase winged helix domain-containing protein n=1 Tax=Choiromyces venosus 120613-1 TaxID=1336337 RepID=A0A3N4JTC8_9PEZI|nr:hypothetical protein L873DRAFT_635200 [Choiromyces venosus 120613-1]